MKQQLIKTFHKFLLANDIDNVMVAIQAVMNQHFVTWREGINEEWEKFGFSHYCTKDFFMYEADSPAMDKYYWRFEELCEKCMDFSLVGKITKPELIF